LIGALISFLLFKGLTPLHEAAAFGAVVVVKYLLSKGAILDAVDGYARPPSFLANFEQKLMIASLLF